MTYRQQRRDGGVLHKRRQRPHHPRTQFDAALSPFGDESLARIPYARRNGRLGPLLVRSVASLLQTVNDLDARNVTAFAALLQDLSCDMGRVEGTTDGGKSRSGRS